MNSCSNYDNLVTKTNKTLEYPIDQESLYDDRIYDKHTSNRRSYEKYTINIVEGFGKMNINRILKWIIIVIILYVILTMLVQLVQPAKIFGVSPASLGFTGETFTKIFRM